MATTGTIMRTCAIAALAGTMILAGCGESDPKPAKAAEAAVSTAPAPDEDAEVAAADLPPVDQSPFVIRQILPIEGAIKYGEWHWDESAAPAEAPVVITVDLDARVLSIFRGGYEIGAAAVLLGTEDKPTPLGVFPITQKRRHHVSNLYGAEMPYMQRLTNDGITLHATDVEWGYASHGCIGMPEPFAAKVFTQTKVGDRVFITRGKMVGIGDSLVDS
ncbi:MAG: L,D-transpeptidase family protein [Novosphingobium sp.]|nr:L,D-transpeptidase family protein [Novosphingobium sp.]